MQKGSPERRNVAFHSPKTVNNVDETLNLFHTNLLMQTTTVDHVASKSRVGQLQLIKGM